jgi:hypothetical protein
VRIKEQTSLRHMMFQQRLDCVFKFHYPLHTGIVNTIGSSGIDKHAFLLTITK